MLKRLFAAAAVACLLAACQTAKTSSAGWQQIAIGVGAVIGETKIDPHIERVSTKLATYCVDVQTAALAVDILAPAKLQDAASAGRIAVATFCAAPPRNVPEALVALANAYAAIETARRR